MKKRTLALALTGAMTLSFAFVGTAPASADWNDCFEGYLCLWGQDNYQGDFCQVPAFGFAGEGWQNFVFECASMNNNMQSWRNRSMYDAKWAAGLNGGGAQHCMDSWSSDPNVTNPNEMSSFRIYAEGANPC